MSLLKLIVAALAIISTIDAVPVSRRGQQYTLVNDRAYATLPRVQPLPLLRRDSQSIFNNFTNTYNQTNFCNSTSSNNQTMLNNTTGSTNTTQLSTLRIFEYNTLNGTLISNQTSTQGTTTSPGLTVAFANNLQSNQLYAYIVGLDQNDQVILLNQDGEWFSPVPTSMTVPQQIAQNISLPLNGQNQTTFIQIPTALNAGRIYVSEGELMFSALATSGGGVTLVEPDFNNPNDPSSIKNWSYVELTTSDQGIAVDISYVDFVGLPLGMSVTTTDGDVINVPGVNDTAVRDICNSLAVYARNESQPWNELCLYNNYKAPLRVAAPAKLVAVDNDAFDDYYSTYVDEVYARYTPDDPLTIITSTTSGNVSCSAVEDTMQCDGANRGFPKPTSAEIFACDGVFQTLDTDDQVVLAVIPVLCAAFQRTTLLTDGGNVQPSGGPSSFYDDTPTNRYAQLVHRAAGDSKGYAFAYDDVHARGEPDDSGLIITANPSLLTITIGGSSTT